MLRSRVLVCVLCPLLGLALIGYLVLAHGQTDVNAQTPVPPKDQQFANGFASTVRPFLDNHCAECHSGKAPKGDLDLSQYTSVDAVAKDLKRWEAVLRQLETETMPPKKAKVHPTPEVRQQVVTWIRDLRKFEAKRNAGDPGQIMARRLSNAEYDYTIRDLTGVDIRPGKEFPVDPTNEAGFDNSGESLMMSPALVTKYVEAARKVSEHILLMPDRLVFADYSVVADTDRDKFGVRQIIDFYKKQRTDYADYFQAAWRYHHRKDLGQPNATLADIAAKDGVSAKYVTTIFGLLTGPKEEVGPIAALQAMWKDLPAPEGKPNAARAGCEKMREVVVKVREKLVPEVKNLSSKSMHNGSQPLVMWKNRTMAANRMRYAGGALKMQFEKFAPANNNAAKAALTAPTNAEAVKKYEAAFTTFCATFPDAFYISERARVYLDPKGEKKLTGRLLNAGLHSQTGYFRDDEPLYDLILSKDDQQLLDRLWLEFDVITGAPIRQYTSFIWFERTDSSFMRGSEFDFARSEDKEVTSENKIKKLNDVFLAKATKNGANQTVQKAVKDYFELMSAQIRVLEKARLAAEPKHVEAIQAFAERAFRRPLSDAERKDIAAFYRRLRDKEGLSHE
ncbi:MAG TPA: DUF1587 domain-containing protein, partial [Gemmataceae bacterium]|nr:DUF1587 domain-containing protein [Gemmataceae bacterium]